ncbi:conserved hypothetical protein [Xenorhabdus nematophila str. Anatoliense]|nr:conserved hypothetical protein [Xenorhabdus nematophila str. Anatoliense]
MYLPINTWEQELLSLHTRLASLFHHPGPQQRSLAYLRGLLSDVERKNGWQLAEWIGERTPDGVQHLLERAHWDVDVARDILRDYVTEHLGDEQGGLLWMKPALSKKARILPACNVNTVAPPDASKTVRQASFSVMPVRSAMPLLTGRYTCPNSGRMIDPAVTPPAFLTQSHLPPNRSSPGRCRLWSGSPPARLAGVPISIVCAGDP